MEEAVDGAASVKRMSLGYFMFEVVLRNPGENVK
jgi:hypothetical protein